MPEVITVISANSMAPALHVKNQVPVFSIPRKPLMVTLPAIQVVVLLFLQLFQEVHQQQVLHLIMISYLPLPAISRSSYRYSLTWEQLPVHWMQVMYMFGRIQRTLFPMALSLPNSFLMMHTY